MSLHRNVQRDTQSLKLMPLAQYFAQSQFICGLNISTSRELPALQLVPFRRRESCALQALPTAAALALALRRQHALCQTRL